MVDRLVDRIGCTWSIPAKVVHLRNFETPWLRQCGDPQAQRATFAEVDLIRRQRFADRNDARLIDLQSAFRRYRIKLVRRLEQFTASNAAYAEVLPRLGQPMNIVGLAFLVAGNDNWHLARISELLPVKE